MKHVKLKIVLLALVAITFGLALVGCGVGNHNYKYRVTFDYNIGNLDEEAKKTTKNQYLGFDEDDALIYKYPNQEKPDSQFPLSSLAGYEFEGWYLPREVDENGEAAVGEDGRVLLGAKWDFSSDRVNESNTYAVTVGKREIRNITLYANFVRKLTLTVVGLNEQGDEVTRKSYNVEEVQREPAQGLAPTASGYTLVEYYKDKDFGEIFTFPYEFGEEEKEAEVYAKFLEGDWAPVKTATDFTNALKVNQNIYVRSEINFAGEGWTTCDYSGIILGNGNKITNLTCNWSSLGTNLEFSLFGALGETFEVHDLSFEGVVLNFTSNATTAQSVSAFAKSIAANAKFENFHYACTLNLTRGIASLNYVTTYAICRDVPAGLNQEAFEVTIKR